MRVEWVMEFKVPSPNSENCGNSKHVGAPPEEVDNQTIELPELLDADIREIFRKLVTADLIAGHEVCRADWDHYASYSAELRDSAVMALEKVLSVERALDELQRELSREIKHWGLLVERARLAQQVVPADRRTEITFPARIANEFSVLGARLAFKGMDMQRLFDILKNRCGVNHVIRNIE